MQKKQNVRKNIIAALRWSVLATFPVSFVAFVNNMYQDWASVVKITCIILSVISLIIYAQCFSINKTEQKANIGFAQIITWGSLFIWYVKDILMGKF